MKPAYWMIGGLLLTGAATLYPGSNIEGVDGLAAGTQVSLGNSLLATAGSLCFVFAWRSAFANLWTAIIGKPRKPTAKIKRRGDARIPVSAENETTSDFDVDAVFARHMEKRAAMDTKAQVPQAPLPAPAAPIRTTGGFGRKVV